jgi:2-(1,2-epoxy-1,2-dihydrophenyl)acetyl-CoA isomerase
VTQVVPAEELSAAVAQLADRLASGPTLAYAAAKRAIAGAVEPPLDAVLRSEGEAQRRLGGSSDHSGAVEAFLAKRRPDFRGR